MSEEPSNKVLKIEQSENYNAPNSSGPNESMKVEANIGNIVIDLSTANIYEKFVLDLTNQKTVKIQNGSSLCCKVLKFPLNSDWDEVLVTLSNLKAENYPNLFIFTIDVKNFEFVEKKKKKKKKTQETTEKFKLIKKYLLKFSRSRPMLLQITSKIDKVTKIFFKDEDSEEFKDIELQVKEQNLSFFLQIFMNHKNENFDTEMIDKMLTAKNSSLILRLFRTLELSEDFWEDLALKCAENGTKDQLLAALDAPFDVKGQMLSLKAQDLLMTTFNFSDGSEADRNISDHPNETSSEKNSNGVTKSILFVAVKNFNKKIIDFLIDSFTFLIQELRHDHQIEISKAASDLKQLDILCDLLDIADFPFPNNFNVESIAHERLRQISTERENFHNAIARNDMETVKKFIDDNSNLKLVYDVRNETALCKALKRKNYSIFCYLKSIGFRAFEFTDYKTMLNDDELANIQKEAWNQTKENVYNSSNNEDRSVMILSARSLIHNKNLSKEIKLKYRTNIQKWFRDIKKTECGKDMVDVAAQCDHFKMIFDFDCELVANMDLRKLKSSGSTYNYQKWIFIGAKMTHEKREQEIKGVIAHELSHYTIGMVFENKEKPYHKKSAEIRENFEGITNEINVWTYQDTEGKKIVRDEKIDDECDGIISTVFTSYEKEDYHPELIVRVAHILAQFGNDPEKVLYLMEKYYRLFDFHKIYVMPEIKKFNSKKRNFNKLFGFLPQIEDFQLEFANPKDLSPLNSTEIVIAVSNVPQLLFHDIYNQACAHQDQKPFIDDKIVFIKSKKFNNPAIANEYTNIQADNKDMRIYVDCSKEFGKGLGSVFVNQTQKIIFVVQNEDQYESLAKGFDQSGRSTQKGEINYEFKDLTLESRKKFLPFFVTFQNRKISIFLLMLNEVHDGSIEQQQEIKVANDLVKVIDTHLLNLLLDKCEISINNYFFVKLSNDTFFVLLVSPRKFIKAFAIKSSKSNVEFTQEQLVEDVRTQKYVIISDIAGTGKSWAMKSIAKFLVEKFETCWVAYVDLKQFVEAFDALKDKPDFLTFMIGNVLKNHEKFESKIFEKLYEKGKTFVLFDGFDEIAPKYNETVVGIIKSFESNGGNQMWIATRDHFEVDLQKELKVNVAYKLDEFTKENGIDMIASVWMLSELKSTKSTNPCTSTADIKNSSNYKNHQCRAQKLIIKISRLMSNSIGFPQFYKMIAEVFEDNRYDGSDLNNFRIYEKFVEIQINKWSTKEGKLRMKKSSKAQTVKIPNFSEVHQFLAMKSFFPDEDEFCGLELDEDDWSDEEIVGCGLVTKSGQNFLFSHETFREYFAVDFILSKLKKGGRPELMEYFIQFLTIQKYEVIRMFINDGLADEAVMRKIEPKMRKLAEKFDKCLCGNENIFANFKENRQSLINLLLNLLKYSNCEKVKNVLDKNVVSIISSSIVSENIIKFHQFFIEFLEVDELKKFIAEHQILMKYVNVNKSSVILEDFVTKVEKKIGREYVRELLSSEVKDGQNIFLFMCSEDPFNYSIFECLIDDIFPKYFEPQELHDLLEQCDDGKNNMLHFCVESANEEMFRFILKKVEKLLPSQNIKQLLRQKCQPNDWNVLQCATKCKKIEIHETFWKTLLRIFEKREELTELILQKDTDDDNFVHNHVIYSTADIIEFTFKMMRKKFSEAQFQGILNSKGKDGRNLLHSAARNSKDIKVHKLLWNILKNLCESNEKFVEIIKFVDVQRWNIFHWAAQNSTSEIFEFICDEIEKAVSREENKKMLSGLSISNRNILHIAAEHNKSLQFHNYLWNILNKFFEPKELIAFVIYQNVEGQSPFDIAVDENTQEIAELTWTKIKELFDNLDMLKNEFKDEISQCDLIMENIIKSCEFDEESKENFETKWKKIVEFLNENFKDDFFQETMPPMKDVAKPENINLVDYDIITNYENRDESKQLIIEKIHKLVSNEEPEKIELFLESCKDKFSDGQFKEILSSKNTKNRNVFQNLVLNQRNVTKMKKIWNILKQHCSFEKKLIEVFEEVDKDNCNILHIAVKSSSSEIFEFLIEELEKIETKQQIKELLTKMDIDGNNFLQIAGKENLNIQLHESLWTVIRKYFESSEMFDFATQLNKDGQNLIFTIITFRIGMELTWNEIEKNLTADEMISLAQQRDKKSKNIVHICVESKNVRKMEFVWEKVKKLFESKNLSQKFMELLEQKCLPYYENLLHLLAECNDIKFHQTLWKLLLITFDSRQELSKLILQKDKYENNFIYDILKFRTADIIKFTFKILKENFSDAQFQEILCSKGFNERNLLQTAALFSKDIKVHKDLWDVFKNSQDSDEKFMEIIKYVEKNKWNVFHYAARYSTSEILEFIIEETEKVASRDEIRNLLNGLINDESNLMTRSVYNESLELHESLWKILQKYFNSQEILDFVNHIDNDGETPFLTASKFSTKEVMEFMWTKIHSFMNENDQFEYLMKTDNQGDGLMALSLKSNKHQDVNKWIEEMLHKYSID